jgi:1-acyl-sn-glycerol-3-phosphate acyltransferase
MTPEIWAILALSVYALIGAAVVVRLSRLCDAGWQFNMLYLLSRLWTNTIFGQRITHRCALPIKGGALLLANHRSPVDPMLILSSSGFKQDGFRLRVLEFMTAREYCNMPGTIGWLCNVMQAIPVERDGKDMGPAKVALRRLRAGRIVGIFPEGGLNTGPGLQPFNEGVAWLALRSGMPVYPVFIRNAPQEGTMITPFHTFSKTDITWGAPVDLSAWQGQKPTPALLQEVAEMLRQHMAKLGGITLDDARPLSLAESGTHPRVIAS